MHQMWRLSEAGPRNLGPAFTDDGLLLGHTFLIERNDGRFVVRARDEIERLIKCAYGGEAPVDRLMSGLARVAKALNANDQCLARIAAVQLQMPDLASAAVRDALATEKCADQIGPRRGRWRCELESGAAPAHGRAAQPRLVRDDRRGDHDPARAHTAGNDDPVARRSDASSGAVDNWVRLPPAKRIDELGDFLEWLANATPEDEETIRAEINRYWVGHVHALSTLHSMLSEVLNGGRLKKDVSSFRT